MNNMMGKKILYHAQSFLRSLAFIFAVVGCLSLIASIILWSSNNDIFVLLALSGAASAFAGIVFWVCLFLVKKMSVRYISIEELSQMPELIKIEKKEAEKVLSLKSYYKSIFLLLFEIFLVGLFIAMFFAAISGVRHVTFWNAVTFLILFTPLNFAFVVYFIVKFTLITRKFLSNRSKQGTINSTVV